ncbi:hypothetical protein V8C34DRAFT_273077 [Trichoderma compactum]
MGAHKPGLGPSTPASMFPREQDTSRFPVPLHRVTPFQPFFSFLSLFSLFSFLLFPPSRLSISCSIFFSLTLFAWAFVAAAPCFWKRSLTFPPSASAPVLCLISRVHDNSIPSSIVLGGSQHKTPPRLTAVAWALTPPK